MSEVIERGFKVLRRKHKKRVSAFAPDEARLQYLPGVRTVRASRKQHGPLALFDTVGNARDFREGFRPCYARTLEIWSCTYEPSEDLRIWYLEQATQSRPLREITTNDRWEGQVFADAITVYEEIE